MGSASDMSALNRSADQAQKTLTAIATRIKAQPDKFLGIHVAVELYRVYLSFEFWEGEVEVEISADPDDEALHPGEK